MAYALSFQGPQGILSASHGESLVLLGIASQQFSILSYHLFQDYCEGVGQWGASPPCMWGTYLGS